MTQALLMEDRKEVALAPVTPMALIDRASAQGATIEQMQQLLDLKFRVEADEAKKAFVKAMSDFKAEPIHIVKDKTNAQYNSKYTSISSLVNTVTPHLSKHGLSADWEISQDGKIEVACVITHYLGHSKRVTLQVPPDASGAKNPLQQIKSAITYARILTFECAVGLASEEAAADDDGNGSGGSFMPEADVVSRMDAIEAARDVAELKTFYQSAYAAAEKMKDKKAMAAFIDAKKKRWKELGGEK